MKSGIDNLIMGIVGLGLLSAFVVGLAISIGSIPFGVIVAGVLVLAFAEFYESALRPYLRSRGG